MADALAFSADTDAAVVATRQRTLRRPRALPGRRAAVGALLVTIALVGLFTSFMRAESGGGEAIVVAAHAIAAGSKIDAGDLRVLTRRVPADLRSHAFASTASVAGGVALAPIAAGELVQRGAVVHAGEPIPFRQLTVPVDAAQIQGLEEGDAVDVLVTTGTGAATRTDVVTGGARVLQVGRRSSSVSVDGKVAVTFSLTSFDDVTRLVQASHAGALTLVRSTGFAPQPSTYDPRSGGARP